MITGVVLVAANMHSDEKGFLPLLYFGTITVVERMVSTFRQAGVDKIVLVSGEEAEQVEKQVSHMGVICLRDADYLNSDLLKSAKIGFSYLRNQCARVGFCPVVVPMFTADTVRMLMQSKEAAVSPVYNGRGGHPLVMDASVMDCILSYEGEGGIPAALKAGRIEKKWLEVADKGTMLNLTREEIPEDLLNSLKNKMLHPQIKISVAREQIFFGPGTYQLLELIEDTHSVRNACQLMHISYSKGWKMIRLMEEQWGHPIVERKQGGTMGGSSYITGAGKDLMARYKLFQQESRKQTEVIFEKYFADHR